MSTQHYHLYRREAGKTGGENWEFVEMQNESSIRESGLTPNSPQTFDGVEYLLFPTALNRYARECPACLEYSERLAREEGL